MESPLETMKPVWAASKCLKPESTAGPEGHCSKVCFSGIRFPMRFEKCNLWNVLRKVWKNKLFLFLLPKASYCTSKSSYFLLLRFQKFIFFVSLFLNQSLFLLWTFSSYHVHKYFFSLYKFSSPTWLTSPCTYSSHHIALIVLSMLWAT